MLREILPHGLTAYPGRLMGDRGTIDHSAGRTATNVFNISLVAPSMPLAD